MEEAALHSASIAPPRERQITHLSDSHGVSSKRGVGLLPRNLQASDKGSLRMNWRFARQVGVPQWLFRSVVWKAGARSKRRDRSLRLATGLRVHLPAGSSFAAEVYVTQGSVDHGAEALLARLTDP